MRSRQAFRSPFDLRTSFGLLIKRLYHHSLRDNLDSIDLRVLFAEGEGDVELAVADGDGDGFYQGFIRCAGFFEDVQVLDLLVFDLDGEDALAGLGDAGVGFGEVHDDVVAAVGDGHGEAVHAPVLGAIHRLVAGAGDLDLAAIYAAAAAETG